MFNPRLCAFLLLICTLTLILTGQNGAHVTGIGANASGGGGGGGVTGSSDLTLTIAGTDAIVNTALVADTDMHQRGLPYQCRSTTGNDTYVCALNTALTAYTRGTCLTLDADTANTGAASVNVDTLGAATILTHSGATPANGDIPANIPTKICHNGTNFYIVGDGGGSTSPVSSVWRPFGPITATGAHIGTIGSANATIYMQLPNEAPRSATTIKTYLFSSGNGTGNMSWAVLDTSCNLIQSTTTIPTPANDALGTWTFSPTVTIPAGGWLALTSDTAANNIYAASTFATGDQQVANDGLDGTTFPFFTGNSSTGTTTLTFSSTCGTRTTRTALLPYVMIR